MEITSPVRNRRIRIAVIDSDPLRLLGFRALFEHESGFELTSVSVSDISDMRGIDLVLFRHCPAQNLFDMVAALRARRPDLRIIVTGSGNRESIVNAIVAGAKGYVDEEASPAEFVHAIQAVSLGSVWAPRRVFSMLIERASSNRHRCADTDRVALTVREREVLELLVAGRSNKEIGFPLGIRERTVKAHVGKMMRKVGVANRIALSIHAVTHSLVVPK
jgi:DNA-binding NarL/FixJ family response regulator